MRERLVAALVGMTVAVLLVVAVTYSYSVASVVQEMAHRTADRALRLSAAAVDERVAAGRPVTASFLTGLAGEGDLGIRYQAADGSTLTAGADNDGEEDYVASQRLAGGGTLTVWRPDEAVSGRVADALLPLVLIALALVALAVAGGVLLARQLSRPFRELAAAAGNLARARFDVPVPHYRVAEAEEIGTALREGLVQLDALLHRERAFAVNASHRLRTPVTSLRLRVEELSLHPDATPELRAGLTDVLEEFDGLTAAVRDVLDHARREQTEAVEDVDVGRLLADASRRGRVAGRVAPQVDAPDGVLVRVAAEPLTQVLSALFDDCARNGAGRVSATLEDQGTHVRIVVGDQGPRRAAPDVLHASSAAPGMSGAVEIAEALGARLLVADDPLHRYHLLVPRP